MSLYILHSNHDYNLGVHSSNCLIYKLLAGKLVFAPGESQRLKSGQLLSNAKLQIPINHMYP